MFLSKLIGNDDYEVMWGKIYVWWMINGDINKSVIEFFPQDGNIHVDWLRWKMEWPLFWNDGSSGTRRSWLYSWRYCHDRRTLRVLHSGSAELSFLVREILIKLSKERHQTQNHKIVNLNWADCSYFSAIAIFFFFLSSHSNVYWTEFLTIKHGFWYS